MSANASSQVTSSNVPRGSDFGFVRRSGWFNRFGSWCTAPNDVPLWHAKPPDTGWSRSGWMAITLPSPSVSATSGQSGSQIRQCVGVSVVPLPDIGVPLVRTPPTLPACDLLEHCDGAGRVGEHHVMTAREIVELEAVIGRALVREVEAGKRRIGVPDEDLAERVPTCRVVPRRVGLAPEREVGETRADERGELA